MFGSLFHLCAASRSYIHPLFPGGVGPLPAVMCPPFAPPPAPRPNPDAFLLVPDTWSGFGFEGQGWLVNTPRHQAHFVIVISISLLPSPVGLESDRVKAPQACF